MSTQNKQLNLPITGTTPGGAGGWGDQLDVNFNNIDNCLGSTLALSLSSTDVILSTGTVTTPGQVSNLRIALSGALSANVNVIFPGGSSGVWLISNAVTGNYTVTLKTTSPSGATIPLTNRFGFFTVYSDGVNMYLVDNVMPPGAIQAFGGTTAPFGWLLCDGTTYGTNAYPALFAAIKYTWGGGGNAFSVPNLQGYFLRGSGTSAIDPDSPRAVGSTQSDLFKSHTHTDSGHIHNSLPGTTFMSNTTGRGIYASGSFGTDNNTVATSYANIQPTGGAETRPANVAVLYCIKT